MVSKMQSLKLFFCCGCIIYFCIFVPATKGGQYRNKRFLIFPRQAPTRHQFIGGIGIPADLAYESLTVGYVLKAEFFLPYNATVFRENPYLPEYKNSYLLNARESSAKGSKLRWEIYEFISNRLQSYGYNGAECVLKAICEANALRFEENLSVFAELMHILLSPSASNDVESAHSTNFKEAEIIGLTTGSDSCSIYACSMSLLNLISSVLKVGL